MRERINSDKNQFEKEEMRGTYLHASSLQNVDN